MPTTLVLRDDAGGKHYGLRAALQHLFVPQGSLSPEYFKFQICDSVQAMCSYLRGSLATYATLKGAGMVGTSNDSSLVIIATLMLKDSAGMVASLCFSYLAAHHFDDETRFWRLFADVINDIGLTLELAAPLFGPYFLTVTVLANICKALCGVAAGATRTAVSAHFALTGNVAEVQAKEGVQETFVTLAGMYAGVRLVQWLVEGGQAPVDSGKDGQPDAAVATHTVAWVAFMLLTVVHVLVNWYGMRLLSLRTLNRSRLYALVRHWILHVGSAVQPGTVPTPSDIAHVDPLLLPPSYGGKVVRGVYGMLPGPFKRHAAPDLPVGDDRLASILSHCHAYLYFHANPCVEPLHYRGQATVEECKHLARVASCGGTNAFSFLFLLVRAASVHGSWRALPLGHQQAVPVSDSLPATRTTPARSRTKATRAGSSSRKASPHGRSRAEGGGDGSASSPAGTVPQDATRTLQWTLPPDLAVTAATTALDACVVAWAPARATGSCHTSVYVAALPGSSSITRAIAYTTSLCLLAPQGGELALAAAHSGQLHTLMETEARQGTGMLEEAGKAGWNTGLGLIGSDAAQSLRVDIS